MSDGAGTWDIGNLSNLILGPTKAQPPLADHSESRNTSSQQSSGHPYPDLEPKKTVNALVLVTHHQDSVESVNHYANYWANRGEPTVVFWIGESGVKVCCFDCRGQESWGNSMVKALSDGNFPALPEMISLSARRLVLVVPAQTDWSNSPFVHSTSQACVIVDPTQAKLIRGYEILKTIAQIHQDCTLSCFVINAKSADSAIQLSSRLERMGYLFLERLVQFSGFSMEEKWPTSNLIAQCFIGENGEENTAQLKKVILGCLTWIQENNAVTNDGQDSALSADSLLDENGPEEEEVNEDDAGQSQLPALKLIRANRSIQTPEQFDRLMGEMIDDVCDLVVESWPIYTPPDDSCCFRWVKHKGGARSIVVTTIDCPFGAFERASAQLHPLRESDEIIVLARTLTTDQRKAAQALHPKMRLYEAAHTPPEIDPPALLLKEVTSASV